MHFSGANEYTSLVPIVLIVLFAKVHPSEAYESKVNVKKSPSEVNSLLITSTSVDSKT